MPIKSQTTTIPQPSKFHTYVVAHCSLISVADWHDHANFCDFQRQPTKLLSDVIRSTMQPNTCLPPCHNKWHHTHSSLCLSLSIPPVTSLTLNDSIVPDDEDSKDLAFALKHSVSSQTLDTVTHTAAATAATALLRLGRSRDYPIFTLPPHMVTHRLPERSYVRSLRSVVTALCRDNFLIPPTVRYPWSTISYTGPIVSYLSHRHTYVSSVPSFLVRSILFTPAHWFKTHPGPPFPVSRIYFVSVVKASPYLLISTTPPPLPISRTPTVAVPTEHCTKAMRLTFSLLPYSSTSLC